MKRISAAAVLLPCFALGLLAALPLQAQELPVGAQAETASAPDIAVLPPSAPVPPATAPDTIDPLAVPADLREPTAAERALLESARQAAREVETREVSSRDAIPALQAGLAASEASYGPQHPATALILSALAEVMYDFGREIEAVPLHRRGLAIYEARFGEAHARTRGRQYWLIEKLVGQRRYDEAEPRIRRLIAVDEATLGADAFEVAVVLKTLVDILRDTGRLGEAVPLLKRAYDITAKVVGADHLMAVSAFNAWASAVDHHGDAAQAETLYRRHVAEREASLGANDPMVGRAVHALARFLEGERRETEAEAEYQRALRIFRGRPGDRARDIASVQFNLARLIEGQGRHAEAEALYREALASDEANHVAGHPEIAASLGALADVVELQGRAQEAEPLRRRALDILEANYGPDDTRTLAALGQLAANLAEQSRDEEGEQLTRRVLEARERTLGPDHADTAWALDAVAIAVENQGRYAEAEPLYLRALATMERAQGAASRDALAVADHLADMYFNWDRLASSEALYRRVLDGRRAQVGPDHPDVGATMSQLAIVLDAQGRHAEAEPLFRQALAIREARLGADHVDTATAIHDLARVLNSLGRYREAAQLDRRALAIREARLGENDPDTMGSLNNLAGDLAEGGLDLEEAGALFRRAIDAAERRFGKDTPDTAVYVGNLGWYYSRTGRPADAELLLRRSLAIRERHWGRDSVDAALSLKNLGVSLDLQGRHAEAEALQRRALSLFEARLGDGHPRVMEVLGYLAASLQAQGRIADAEREARRAVAIARAQRERESARADALASARAFGDAADPLQAAYRDYLPIAWANAADTAGDAARLRDHAFTAAQDLDVSGAARALAQAAARIAGGSCAQGAAENDCLAALARRQQDLAARLRDLDRTLLAATGAGDAAATRRLREQIADAGRELQAVDTQLRERFPDYAAMVSPRALDIAQAQARLRDGEGLLLVMPAGADVFVFGVGTHGAQWHRLAGGAARVAQRVAKLRCQADPATCGSAAGDATRGVASVYGQAIAQGGRPFDREAAHALYQDIVAPVEAAFADATRLYVVASGPLGSLPLGVLVTQPPLAGEDDADPAVLARTAWLADRYALTTLPAVASLRALVREAATSSDDAQAFVGFGDPVLLGNAGATRGASNDGGDGEPRVFRSADAKGLALADPSTLRALAPLPGTRVELAAMAQALGARDDALRLGDAATEAAVKTSPALPAARVVAFATHGLLPREVRGLDEPGLVFTPPPSASSEDDGVLAASEAAMLRLDADWLILSACNTAAADGTGGGDSLSGLARAFLYAGARALLVSHWRVRDDVTAALTVQTLRDRRVAGSSRAQALQRAMRAVRTGVLADGTPLPGWTPAWAHPSAWAPFVVVSDQDQ